MNVWIAGFASLAVATIATIGCDKKPESGEDDPANDPVPNSPDSPGQTPGTDPQNPGSDPQTPGPQGPDGPKYLSSEFSRVFPSYKSSRVRVALKDDTGAIHFWWEQPDGIWRSDLKEGDWQPAVFLGVAPEMEGGCIDAIMLAEAFVCSDLSGIYLHSDATGWSRIFDGDGLNSVSLAKTSPKEFAIVLRPTSGSPFVIRRYKLDQGWSPDESIPFDAAIVEPLSAKIASNGEGLILLVVEDKVSSSADAMWSATFEPGSGWQAFTKHYESTYRPAFNGIVRPRVNRLGDLVIGWERLSPVGPDDRFLVMASKKHGGSWTAASEIRRDYHGGHEFFLDQDGGLVVSASSLYSPGLATRVAIGCDLTLGLTATTPYGVEIKKFTSFGSDSPSVLSSEDNVLVFSYETAEPSVLTYTNAAGFSAEKPLGVKTPFQALPDGKGGLWIFKLFETGVDWRVWTAQKVAL